jgi:nicotinamide-nucleotide amidase
MFDKQLLDQTDQLLSLCRRHHLMIASAESCTGGLISALFTEIAGSSDVFERGFVTYSNEAKGELLDVPMGMIAQFGAVSEEVAKAMAEGALDNSLADLAVAVTGIAGPGGGSAEKPVGLVHLAVARKSRLVLHKVCQFGNPGRSKVRILTVIEALKLLRKAVEKT